MTVVLNEQALAVLLDSEIGAVGRDTRRRTEAVKQQALANVQDRFVMRTGSLLRSVKSEVGTDTLGLRGKVYCDPDIAPHAIYLEKGTSPHPIDARRAPVLESESGHPDPLSPPENRADPTHVDHPGNEPFNFLRDALGAAAV